MKFKDYYLILGVKKTATAIEIKTAYRQLARKYHPDISQNDKSAETKFKEINEANEVLGDPDNRRQYDQLGANWRHYGQPSEGRSTPFTGFNSRSDSNFSWNVDLGGEPGGRSLSEDEVRKRFGDKPFSDFFGTFFSGADPVDGRARRSRQGHLNHVVELDLKQAFQGEQRRFTIQFDPIASRQTLEVKIPAGVTEGSRIRVPGNVNSTPPGDIYLTVRIRPHPVFECKGRNLYTTVAVAIPTAVLGGQISITTLAGDSLRLKIPKGTQPGQVLRVKTQGMPRLGPRLPQGDLYVSIELIVPKNVSAKVKELYQALAGLASESSSTVKSNPNQKTKSK